MPRIQVQYQGRGERVQARQPEMIQAIRARNETDTSAAFQLAKALGAIDTDSWSNSAQKALKTHDDKEREAAQAYANSLTVDELGKRVKEGALLPSQSPAFAAALQHIYGENTQSTFERDTLSKLTAGQLKFGSPEEMDKYLTEHRNEVLSGASKYTVAGFDKGYTQFREKALSANTQFLDKQSVERGMQEGSDNLGNVLLQVTQPGFKGDAAQTLMDRYQLLRKTSLLREDAGKEALNGLVTRIASSGNQTLTDAVLNKTVEGGVSVRAVLGEIRAASFVQHAEAQNDSTQRQRIDVELRPFLDQADKGELDEKGLDKWAKDNERWVSTSTLHMLTNANQAARERALKALEQSRMLAAAEASVANANQTVRAAVQSGNLAFLPEQQVMTPSGEMKAFDSKRAAQTIITEDVERMKMPLGKATEYWATNNVENPEWQKEIQAGASNVASVGWSYAGKGVGQLNPQGQRAIETFMRVNATHPAYAEKLVGNGKDYKTLSDIQFLVEKGGFPNVSDAAALINQVNRSDIKQSDYGSMTASVKQAVDDVVSPGFWSSRAKWFNGLFGNDQTNLTSVQADIRRRAELLVMSGQVPDAAAAVKATVEYLANPAVTTRINNTVYFNKDLPVVPKGEDPGKLMERFIKEVPEVLARGQKMSGDVRLEPNQYGGFTGWVGGQPLIDERGQVQTYRKEDVSSWIDGAIKADRHKAIAEKNFTLWQERVSKEFYATLPKDSLPGTGQGYLHTLTSRKTYERFLKDGHVEKPVKELMQLYKKPKQGK